MAEKALNGTKWELDTSENFDKFMEKLDVNFVTRKIGNTIKNSEEWCVDGEDWSLTISSTFTNKSRKFKIGKEFDDETLDGRKVKTTYTLDGDKLVQTQVGKPYTTVITREVKDGVLVVIYTIPEVPDLTCVRTYKRIN